MRPRGGMATFWPLADGRVPDDPSTVTSADTVLAPGLVRTTRSRRVLPPPPATSHSSARGCLTRGRDGRAVVALGRDGGLQAGEARSERATTDHLADGGAGQRSPGPARPRSSVEPTAVCAGSAVTVRLPLVPDDVDALHDLSRRAGGEHRRRPADGGNALEPFALGAGADQDVGGDRGDRRRRGGRTGGRRAEAGRPRDLHRRIRQTDAGEHGGSGADESPHGRGHTSLRERRVPKGTARNTTAASRPSWARNQRWCDGGRSASSRPAVEGSR